MSDTSDKRKNKINHRDKVVMILSLFLLFSISTIFSQTVKVACVGNWELRTLTKDTLHNCK
jgi:hypothetical protein